jgi:MYXO-CTERM domain-containing protein
MFKRSILSAFILAAGLISAQANASFQFTDWKTVGDKKSLLDGVTGQEWLRLSQTGNKSISDVLSQLSTTYAGWRLPTNAEVTKFVTNIYGGLNLQFHEVTARNNYYAMYLGANRFVDWMSNGYKYATSHGGLYYDEDGQIRFFGAYMNEGGEYTITVGLESSYSYSVNSRINGTFGVFLVSDGGTTLSSINNPMLNINNPNAPVNQVPEAPADVPVHAGFGLLGLLLMAFGIRRRKSL